MKGRAYTRQELEDLVKKVDEIVASKGCSVRYAMTDLGYSNPASYYRAIHKLSKESAIKTGHNSKRRPVIHQTIHVPHDEAEKDLVIIQGEASKVQAALDALVKLKGR